MANQSLEATITQRRGRYGPLIESGEVAMKTEDYWRSLPGWEKMAYDQREALAMIAHKISRIMCGDPDYDDSWVDIAGYAQNVVNRLRYEQKTGAITEPSPPPPADMPALDLPSEPEGDQKAILPKDWAEV